MNPLANHIKPDTIHEMKEIADTMRRRLVKDHRQTDPSCSLSISPSDTRKLSEGIECP